MIGGYENDGSGGYGDGGGDGSDDNTDGVDEDNHMGNAAFNLHLTV